MELEHFSHPPHPLIFNTEQISNGERVYCSGCQEEVVSGPNYSCVQCNFFLHKKCAELPRKIKHPFHRKHPLILLANPLYDSKTFLCDFCSKPFHSFVYHCSTCHFDLDIKCASSLCIIDPENRGHQFIRLFKPTPFTCDACGRDGIDKSPHLCIACQVMVHESCISLPYTVNIVRHGHPITHTYFLEENESGKQVICGICQNKVDKEHGVYNCSDCNYVAHVDCAKDGVLDATTEVNGNGIQEPSTTAVVDESIKSMISCIIKEISLGEDKIAVEIQHDSHPHNLILLDEVEDNKCCVGCMIPISAPFYSCGECPDFFLHKACAELPGQRRHPLHAHPLTLLSRSPTIDGLFWCDACARYCHGFTYNCEKCNFNIDVRCSSILDTLRHEGHEDHILLLSQRSDFIDCSACSNSDLALFSCVQCNFNLDFRCATLPRAARHRYHDHPLTLTFNSLHADDFGQYYCDICEHTREGNHWFYYCGDCDFSAHTECIFGKNPYIKLGGTYKDDKTHIHPLTLVQKSKNYLPCHLCSRPCDDLALECTDSSCNFSMHRKLIHCDCTLHK